MKIVKDQSAQTTARVVRVVYRLYIYSNAKVVTH